MRHLGWVFVVGACAHNVPQDKATGPDGRTNGAAPLELKNGEARARGIVTYPGGDRVDWKSLQLPEKQAGTLDLQLTWQAPRPGLQVAFDVFDEWGARVASTNPGRRTSRQRTATIEGARGKYFVRVYAPQRGDAGEYKLVAAFTPLIPHGEPPEFVIPDPPRLPALPEVEDAPPPPPPTTTTQVAPTPQPPPPVPPKASPLVVRTIGVEVRGDASQVTLAIGSERAPIDTTWTAEVLSKDTGKPIIGGKLILVRVGKTQTVAKSTLTIDQLTANPQVRLSPP